MCKATICFRIVKAPFYDTIIYISTYYFKKYLLFFTLSNKEKPTVFLQVAEGMQNDWSIAIA